MPKQEMVVYEMIRDRNKEKRILWERLARYVDIGIVKSQEVIK